MNGAISGDRRRARAIRAFARVRPSPPVIALLAVLGLPPAAANGQYPTSPPPPGPLRPMQFPPFREARFANGLEMILVENHELPIVSVSLAMPAGARHEPAGREGLVGLVAELLTKGTTTRTADQIAAEIEGVGGSLSASAGDDFFTVSVTVLTDHLDLGLGLMSDVLLNATFPEDEVELARTRVLSSLQLEKADPGALASKFFSRTLYGDHPYGRSPSDTSIRALTREEIQRFAATWLKPRGALLVVAGDLSLSDARSRVERYLGRWTGAPPAAAAPASPPAARPTSILLVHRPGSAQSNIAVGNLALTATDPLHFSATVANKILGGGADSRLFLILREQKSWTYGAGSGLSRRRDIGHFSASTEVRTAVTDSALTELLTQLSRMRSEAVADSELVAAKGYLVGSFPLSIETPQQVAGQASSVKLLGLPDDYLRTYRDRLAAVTAADVMAAARRVIRPDSAVIVVVGDGTAVYERLTAIAPVRMVDTDGKALTPEDLGPKAAGPLVFDREHLVTRRDSFQVSVQGNPFGYMVAGLVVSPDSIVYVEETVIAAAGFRQRTVVRLDPETFAARTVDQTGSGAGQTLETHLVYENGRVKGRAQTPVPGAAAPKVADIDTALAPGTIDVNALQPLVAALPLAEGASIAVATFDASDVVTRTLTAKVSGVQDVTVLAGTFSAFRVEVSGGQQPLVFYVSRTTPRRLLKIEIVGQPFSFELVR